MLTSPVVVLLAWGGVRGAARIRASAGDAARCSRSRWRAGVLASDALQYHGSNLAPTARYEELASIDSRFAGSGPALFTDFDEYSLYELRDLDVGGPDFVYPPPALAACPSGYGDPVDLDRLPPAALRSYPLIVTRRDPAAARPPSAYACLAGHLLPGVGPPAGRPAALARLESSSTRPIQCSSVAGLARIAMAHGAQLVSARPPELVPVDVAHASHPAWKQTRLGLLMSAPGRLEASFAIPPHRRVGTVAPGGDHAGDRGKHRSRKARVDQRSAHRCRNRPRHDGAAARPSHRRSPPREDYPC